MRGLTVGELVEELIATKRPHTKVEVRGRILHEVTRGSLEALHFQQAVVGVRTEANLVVIEVRQ